jgi:hypothetical protein
MRPKVITLLGLLDPISIGIHSEHVFSIFVFIGESEWHLTNEDKYHLSSGTSFLRICFSNPVTISSEILLSSEML